MDRFLGRHHEYEEITANADNDGQQFFVPVRKESGEAKAEEEVEETHEESTKAKKKKKKQK